MQRKRTTDKVQRLRGKDGEDLRLLACKAARWAADHETELAAADPETPPQLNDRAADAWSPLLAIADTAGGVWPERARRAAIRLCGEETSETVETLLLADIRDVFEKKRKATQKFADRISSQDLMAFLVDREDRPWAEINKGRPLTKASLAARLRPFRISPGTIRFGDEQDAPTAKGYYRKAFEDVFARYLSPLPPDSPDQTVTPSQAAETLGFSGVFKTSHPSVCDVSELA